MLRSAVLAPAALLLLPPFTAAADTLKVPSAAYPTIADAVAAAVEGDTIAVGPGTYPTITVSAKIGIKIVAHGKVEIDPAGSDSCIEILNCQDLVLKGFTVRNAMVQNILVASSTAVTVTKCKVYGGPGDGILAQDGASILIDRNLIEGVGNRGIFVDGSDVSFILRNKIISPGTDGIRMSGIFNVVEKNRIDLAGADGIFVEAGGTGAELLKNRIELPGDDGIEVAGMDGFLDGNLVKDAQDDGFVFSGTGTEVVRCTASKPLSSGFLLPLGDSCTLVKCKVVGAGADGFFVDGSDDHIFVLCRSVKATQNGFQVGGIFCQFLKCAATGSGVLDLEDAAGAATTNLYMACHFKLTNVP